MSTEDSVPPLTPKSTAAPEPAPGMAPAPSNSIVVGHDGSSGADRALTTALELADQLRAPIVVVRAWSIETAPRPANWEFGYVSSFPEYAAAVRSALVQDVHAATAAFPSVEVDYVAVHAGAARSLIEASRNARMLVVGSRGRGGLAGLLLGSVSDQCVRLAECPVLVARPRPRH